MKKIDLHIHTVPIISDADFVFSMATLKDYIKHNGLDAIAVTNHNCKKLSPETRITVL